MIWLCFFCYYWHIQLTSFSLFVLFFQDVASQNNQSSFTQGTCLGREAPHTAVRIIRYCKVKHVSPRASKDSHPHFFLLFRRIWLWCCRQFANWDVASCWWWRASVCGVEGRTVCHERWAAVGCHSLVVIWLQPAGLPSSDSGLRSRPDPHSRYVHAGCVPQLHHAGLHAHAAAH